jgi:hypothetical protein
MHTVIHSRTSDMTVRHTARQRRRRSGSVFTNPAVFLPLPLPVSLLDMRIPLNPYRPDRYTLHCLCLHDTSKTLHGSVET